MNTCDLQVSYPGKKGLLDQDEEYFELVTDDGRERIRIHEYDRVYDDYGYGSTTWSPLASGILTGKYQNGIPAGSRGAVEGYEWLQEGLQDADRLAAVSALEPIAADMGATLAQFSLAWCLQNPYVSSVITGASRVEQVRENMKALDFVEKFSDEVMAEIDKALGGGVPRYT